MIWQGRNQNADAVDAPGIDGGDVGPGPSPQAGQDSVGTRIESVLDAAEQAADGIRADAQEWARRYMEDSRRRADELAAQRVRELSQLTEGLMSRARAVAKQSDDLISALDQVGRKLVGNDSGPAEPRVRNDAPQPATPAPSPSPPPVREPTPAPIDTPPRQPQPRESRPVSDGARLLVTQMSVAGSSREEIIHRLRDEFGVRDAGGLLDQLGL